MKAKNKDKGSAERIAVVAGGTELPKEVIESMKKEGMDPFVIGLKNFVKKDVKTDIVIRLGEGGKAAKALEKNGIKKIVMVGAIGQPDLSDLRPDWWSVKIVAKALMNDKGHDTLLTTVLKEIEKKGFQMVAVQDVCKGLTLEKGVATKTKPKGSERKVIDRAIHVCRIIGEEDIGQSVIVDRVVLGVEGADGTDALIKRCAQIRKGWKKQAGVMAKLKKPQQDIRIDIPVIGIDTLKLVKEANLRGIVIEANYCFVAQKEKTLAYADKHNIFIEAV